MQSQTKEYKNPPDVRAVLARVRAEQRLRAKQKASVSASQANHANLAKTPTIGAVAVE